MTIINKQSSNVHFDGYKGTYYCIDWSYDNYGRLVYLMESEQSGDETEWLFVSSLGDVICETYDDINTTLEMLG